MKSRVAVLFVVFCVGAALFFLRNGTDPAVRKQPADAPRAVPRAAPFGVPITPAPSKPVEATPSPTPTPAPEAALQEARRYYDAHIARMREIINVDYPHAVARRQNNHNQAAVRQFFKDYPRTLEEAHPVKAAEKAADEYFDHLSKEEQEKMKSLLLPTIQPYNLGFLADELNDNTAVGTETLGGITREALQSPQGTSAVRTMLAQFARDNLHDEAAAQQVEAFTTGDQVMDSLRATQERAQAWQDQNAAALPLPEEQVAVVNRALQISAMSKLNQLYESMYNGRDDFLRNEFRTLLKGAQDRLNQIAEDSPEKRGMLDGLSDLFTQIDALGANNP